MARSIQDDPALKIPQLQPTPKLSETLKQDDPNDCLPCRVIGASAFVGLGAYGYLSGQHQLQQQEAVILKSKSFFGLRSRQAGITGIAAALVATGLWRLVN